MVHHAGDTGAIAWADGIDANKLDKSEASSTYALRPWINVKESAYDAKGDGSTDDTTAIQAAITACPIGGTVYFPASSGHYVFTTLTVGQGVTLLGSGWQCIANAGFGYSGYVSGTDKPFGSVLRSTATTGTAITFASTVGYGPFSMKNLAVCGPGTGTSNGIAVGESPTAVNARNLIENCMVVNFGGIGWELIGCEDSTFADLRATGCGTGIMTSNAFNQNVMSNIEVEYTSVDGFVLTGEANDVRGVLVQNCSGNSGFTVDSASPSNLVTSLYTENNTATDGVLVKSATTLNTGRAVSNGGRWHITAAASGCLIEHIYAVGVTLLLDAGTVLTTLVRCDFTTYTYNGCAVIDTDQITGMGPWSTYTPALAVWAIGNGVIEGWYTQIGKTVHYEIALTFGSTSTFVGSPTITLPPVAGILGDRRTPAYGWSNGGGGFLTCGGFQTSTTTVVLILPSGAGMSGGQFYLAGTYETP